MRNGSPAATATSLAAGLVNRSSWRSQWMHTWSIIRSVTVGPPGEDLRQVSLEMLDVELGQEAELAHVHAQQRHAGVDEHSGGRQERAVAAEDHAQVGARRCPRRARRAWAARPGRRRAPRTTPSSASICVGDAGLVHVAQDQNCLLLGHGVMVSPPTRAGKKKTSRGRRRERTPRKPRMPKETTPWTRRHKEFNRPSCLRGFVVLWAGRLAKPAGLAARAEVDLLVGRDDQAAVHAAWPAPRRCRRTAG